MNAKGQVLVIITDRHLNVHPLTIRPNQLILSIMEAKDVKTWVDYLVWIGVCKYKSEARRLIMQGALKVYPSCCECGSDENLYVIEVENVHTWDVCAPCLRKLGITHDKEGNEI